MAHCGAALCACRAGAVLQPAGALDGQVVVDQRGRQRGRGDIEQSTSVDYETYLNIQKEKDRLKQKWREPKA